MVKVKKVYTKTYNVLRIIGNYAFNLIIAILIANLVCKVVLNVDASIYGYKPMHVVSESMEPTIMTNGLILAKRITNEEIKVGDIVGYEIEENNSLFTIIHRIVDIDDGIIKMKGDNNPRPDVYNLEESDIKFKVVYINNSLAYLLDTFFGSKAKTLASTSIIVVIYFTMKESHKKLYINNSSIMDI